MSTNAIWTIILIAVSGIAIAGWYEAFANNKIALAYQAQVEQLTKHAMQGAQAGQDFLNACRLISIARNGRSLFFTFSRGDAEPFIIETMSLMSDNLNEWEEKTGVAVL